MLDIQTTQPYQFIEANEVCSKITKGTTPPASEIVADADIPFIRVNNLTQGGAIGLASSLIYISRSTHVGLLGRSIARPGDILMNIVGPPLGKVTLLTDCFGEYNLNQAVIIFRPIPDRLDPYFFYYYICSYEAQSWFEVRSKKTSGQQNLTIELCKQLPVPLLPILEQRKIAEVLRTWDEALKGHDRFIERKKFVFAHLAISLLTGGRRTGRTCSNWKTVALTDVTAELTARNNGRHDAPSVMSVNKTMGMIPMKEHVRAADLSRYKIVPPGAFAYNPMRLNIGSLARNEHGREVLVSPDYVVFAAKDGELDGRFFNHLRRTRLWSSFVEGAGSGGVRVRIYYDDLADFEIELPPLQEQRHISGILDTAAREISLLQSQRDALARQKRGLMQKLLTGEWRVGEAAEAATQPRRVHA